MSFEDILNQKLKRQVSDIKQDFACKTIIDSNRSVVIGEKCLPEGAWHGHISSGGGIIEIGNNKAISITKSVSNGKSWVTFQILDAGIGRQVATQRYQAKKIVREKVFVPKKPTVKKETFSINKNIEQKSIFDN